MSANQSRASWLEGFENQIEKQLLVLTGTFQQLSEDKLLQPSPTGSWSIAECLWHLNSYFEYYLPAIRKKMEKQTTRTESQLFKGSWMGNWFVKLMVAGGRKFKAFKTHVPPKGLNGQAEITRCIQFEEELLQLIRQSQEMDWRKTSIPISIHPWVKLPLGDVFRFLLAHNERHLEQGLRNL